MIESIGAGYIIGVMAHFYSRCNYPIIGAVLFGLGLLTICHCKLSLFTGKIGTSPIPKCLLILLGNIFGVVVAIILLQFSPTTISNAIACGILMQMAVTLYEKYPWATVGCVAAFLLGGFKHCVAMLYNMEMTVDYWVLFVITVFWNGFGAIVTANLGVRKKEDNA